MKKLPPHILTWKGLTLPPLVVGKGPSCVLATAEARAGREVIAINEATDRVPAQATFFNDYERYLQARPMDDRTIIAMPYRPHWGKKPGRPLHDLLQFDRSLQEVHAAGRLFGYDISTAKDVGYPEHAVYATRVTTTETALQVLADMGFREVFTLGIDGGPGRAAGFSAHHQRGSYDSQFRFLDEIAKRRGMRIINLAKERPCE